MKFYQVYITSTDKNGKMNRFSFSSFHLKVAMGIGAVLLIVFGIVSVDYSLSVYNQAELKRLRVENTTFKAHIKDISNQVQSLESNIEKIEDFSTKLKMMTRGKSQSSIGIGIGPVPHFYPHPSHNMKEDESSKDSASDLPKNSANDPVLKNSQSENFQNGLSDQVAFLQKKSSILFNEIWTTLGILEENKHLLRTTPSIIPAKGWITSRFGYRNYPVTDGFKNFSSLVDFHGGLDIAAPKGTVILAPADGVVSSVGADRRTGNYIALNHGYQLKTLYGHLDKIYVKASQKVTRGDVIGTIGNTGRSTGPHLHYEIRIANKAVNPEYYFFD